MVLIDSAHKLAVFLTALSQLPVRSLQFYCQRRLYLVVDLQARDGFLQVLLCLPACLLLPKQV